VDRDDWAIDWELFKVRATVTIELSVKVREDTALKKGIITEIDTTHKVGGLELCSS
jgi:hypothetical protein